MARKVFHVVWKKEIWNVKEAGSNIPVVRAQKKEVAVDKAREVAKRTKPAQIRVHRKDGTIEFENTYGGDPEKYKS